MYKNDFPILNRRVNGRSLVYLDSAATAQKPKVVIDAVVDFYAHTNSPVARGVYQLAEDTTQQYEDVRTQVADFLGADSQEIIFTKGATDSINMVAQGWADQHIGHGDEIVVTQLEHHSNLVPWQRLAQKKGAILRVVPGDDFGALQYDQLSKIITNKTKLVACIMSSNALGIRVDVEQIIARAKEVGAVTLIDGAQSVGFENINLHKLGCDFFAFSGHKMLGPTGVGCLYIAQNRQPEVMPTAFGGGAVYEVGQNEATLLPAPHCYEPGTPAIAQVVGLGAAISYVQSIGEDAIGSHANSLVRQLVEGLQKLPKMKILGPVEQIKKEAHLVSFTVDGIHPHDVAAFLDQRGICVRAGHHCVQPLSKRLGYDASVRVSFHIYNTKSDVDQVLLALQEL